MNIETMKLALEALEGSIAITMAKIARRNEAIIVLRAAIAEASCDTRIARAIAAKQRLTDVQQEMEQDPVAWLNPEYGTEEYAFSPEKSGGWCVPLYTYPPRREWVGLTDEDLSVCDEDGVLLARYWEAKLKEKNQ
jgi:hypothetical protein